MTPEQRAAVRSGCNLAFLPADVRDELARELQQSAEQYQAVKRPAAQLFGLRRNRLRVERELAQLGDLEQPVRAALNTMISGGDKHAGK